MFWEIFGISIITLFGLSMVIALGNKLATAGKLSQGAFGVFSLLVFAATGAALAWYFTTKYFCGLG